MCCWFWFAAVRVQVIRRGELVSGCSERGDGLLGSRCVACCCGRQCRCCRWRRCHSPQRTRQASLFGVAAAVVVVVAVGGVLFVVLSEHSKSNTPGIHFDFVWSASWCICSRYLFNLFETAEGAPAANHLGFSASPKPTWGGGKGGVSSAPNIVNVRTASSLSSGKARVKLSRACCCCSCDRPSLRRCCFHCSCDRCAIV